MVRRAGVARSGGQNGLKTVPALRLYAILELVVAAAALLLPFALAASVPALSWAYADGTASTRFAVVRVAISLALIGVPAVAMGATFPIASEWYANAGVLYAANTAGAALGAVAAGFWLVPALGLRGTTWVGVALNIVAAAGALWLVRHYDQRRTRRRAETTVRLKESSASSAVRVGVVFVARARVCGGGDLGFTALVYEVAWTRLALVIGPTTYAFATMAAAFITGSPSGRRSAHDWRAESAAGGLACPHAHGGACGAASAWFAATRLHSSSQRRSPTPA